jgi:hypothetical protein
LAMEFIFNIKMYAFLMCLGFFEKSLPKTFVPHCVCTNSLTLTFYPHSAFMCFVWIWEQTAIISIYSFNWQIFIRESVIVYCAVRAEYILYGNYFRIITSIFQIMRFYNKDKSK